MAQTKVTSGGIADSAVTVAKIPDSAITKYDCKYVGVNVDIDSNYGSKGMKGKIKFIKQLKGFL